MELKIEYIDIDKLTPYAANAKLHTDVQIEQICDSIRKFGMNDPIAIWGDKNLIIEGHGRLMACQKLGIGAVPIIRLDDLTDEQRKAYTLIHNQTTMNTGFDIDILKSELDSIHEIDMSRWDFNLNLNMDVTLESDGSFTAEYAEIDDDEYNESEHIIPKKVNKGDLWKLGNHYLLCGDSTNPNDVKRLMQGKLADMVVTDPPYNVNYEGNTKDKLKIANDNKSSEEFHKFLVGAFECLTQNLKEGGHSMYGSPRENMSTLKRV